jgi:hypothetical protein
MKQHPYVRAYLAGIAVPSVFLLVVMTGYIVFRYVYDFPVPIERVIVFPMAVVPNVWGLWNVIYAAFLERRHLPLGLFGGALPLLLAPGGYLVARLLAFPIPNEVLHIAPFALPIGLIIYYLAWKYFVGFLNAELGVA